MITKFLNWFYEGVPSNARVPDDAVRQLQHQLQRRPNAGSETATTVIEDRQHAIREIMRANSMNAGDDRALLKLVELAQRDFQRAV